LLTILQSVNIRTNNFLNDFLNIHFYQCKLTSIFFFGLTFYLFLILRTRKTLVPFSTFRAR